MSLFEALCRAELAPTEHLAYICHYATLTRLIIANSLMSYVCFYLLWKQKVDHRPGKVRGTQITQLLKSSSEVCTQAHLTSQHLLCLSYTTDTTLPLTKLYFFKTRSKISDLPSLYARTIINSHSLLMARHAFFPDKLGQASHLMSVRAEEAFLKIIYYL